jgi:hypothetical protein
MSSSASAALLAANGFLNVGGVENHNKRSGSVGSTGKPGGGHIDAGGVHDRGSPNNSSSSSGDKNKVS